jgi:hypothetical protein
MKKSKHLQLSVAFSACDGKGRRRPESRGVAAAFAGQQPKLTSRVSQSASPIHSLIEFGVNFRRAELSPSETNSPAPKLT